MDFDSELSYMYGILLNFHFRKLLSQIRTFSVLCKKNFFAKRSVNLCL